MAMTAISISSLAAEAVEETLHELQFDVSRLQPLGDRTIQTFMRVAQLEGHDNLPSHYALLATPSDPSQLETINQRLADAHVTPIWYPDGDHQCVEQILELLLD